MQDFFGDTSVFITGATGFLGKSVVEKLLRAVPSVHKIYILIRPKRGQSGSLRLQQLLQSPVFDRVKQENAGVLDKITPIVGDIASPEMGISPEDRILLEQNVSVVIHCAATIKFNENLKIAVEINVCGTQRVVQLCKGMTNLKALVYVSTAYSNCDRKEAPIQELVYPVPPEAITLLSKIDTMEAEYFEKNGKSFLGKKPNTYTFTKALAEYMLETEVTGAGLPTCIVRPSMITNAWKEPMPGWVQGFGGPLGLSLAIGNGLLKIIFGDSNINFDLVPVDMVINIILTAAWQTGHHRKPLTVYNCCSGPSNPLSMGDYLGQLEHHFRTTSPLCRAVCYPQISVTLNRPWHLTHRFLFHYLPACLLDFLTILLSLPRHLSRCPREGGTARSKRAPKFASLHKKIMTGASTVEYFTGNGWHFETNNMTRLQDALTELPVQEQSQWSFQFSEFTWDDYLARMCRGIKTFLAKEPETTLPAAQKRNRRLQLIKISCDVLGILCFLIVAGMVAWMLLSVTICISPDVSPVKNNTASF